MTYIVCCIMHFLMQEDFGCSKDIDDSDEKVLISDKDEV